MSTVRFPPPGLVVKTNVLTPIPPIDSITRGEGQAEDRMTDEELDQLNATVQTSITYLVSGTPLDVRHGAIIAAFSTLNDEEKEFFSSFLAMMCCRREHHCAPTSAAAS